MLYDYICQDCGKELKDVKQSMKDDALTQCPSCGKPSLQRVIYGGLGSFMKDVKTVGQAADKNWKKLGSYKRSEIESQQKETQQKNKSPLSDFGPASRKEINKMTPEQKKKYIIEGTK